MNTNADDNLDNARRGIELEYSHLRSEILKRIELRQQIATVTLTLAGIFLGLGVTTESVVLIYPPLATFLALGWAQNDFRVRDLAKYLREEVEPKMPGLGYELYIQKKRGMKAGGLGSWRFVVLSHGGIFLLTQFMAILVELSKFSFNLLEYVLMGVDFVSILVVLWVVRQSKR
ncbi:hypothetical protein HUU40_24825 [candidate division KSB1 bacterium]|nr:hypothetical protein [candidate division KSB1 bacterium]